MPPRLVVRGRQQLRSEDALTLPGERRGQIWGNAIALVPGRYLLSVRTQEDGDSRSLRPIPFVVRDLAPRQLSLSDLELAHADPTSPAYPFERRGVRYLADPVAHIHQGLVRSISSSRSTTCRPTPPAARGLPPSTPSCRSPTPAA